MYNTNIDNSPNSANMPPRGSSDRSKSQTRKTRSSTLNRSLHRTLRSQSPSSSITRRSHDQRNIVADPSIHSTNILSSSIHSGKNVQASLNLDQNDDDITMELNSVVIDVNSYQNQNFPATTNSFQAIHPFELDKALPPKKTTTFSGKKTAEEVWRFFEMQHDGTYKCLLCLDTHKVIQQNNRGTANLRSHLLFHGMKDYAFKSQEDQRNPQKNNTPIISLSHQRKREIDEALLQCIIEAGLPYSMFNHGSVNKFLKVLIQ
ncbi:unnamed protein product [Rotaria sp. Silwood2]|nr:unnamed protein product [Rotaria sp. Silwood2]CAF4294493.1 unnamed protein product [Rotaria sp. Silwood2]